MNRFLFYVGSFADAFHLCALDAGRGTLEYIKAFPHLKPAHLALSGDRTRLYAASEMFGEEGCVTAYNVKRPEAPQLLSCIRSGTQGPGYIALSGNGRYLLGCSYFEGNIELFPVREGGALGERCFHSALTGTGTAYVRGSFGQAVPRAHCIEPVRDTDLVLVTDYSGDQLLCLRDGGGGTLLPLSRLDFPKGDAPRHLALHPQRDDLVLMNAEFTARVYLIQIDRESGAMTILDSIHTLQGEKASFSSCIRVSGDGRFVYVPNRNNGNVSVLALSDDFTRLERVGALPDTGFVRDLAIDPTGDYLILGDQEEGSVRLYRRNRENGMCAPLAGRLAVDTPASFV